MLSVLIIYLYLYFVQINKAKIICDCLIASEGIDLKLEDAFCLFLLGEVCFFVPPTYSNSAVF